MNEKQCSDPHPLRGMKVLQTIEVDNGLMRRRACEKCDLRVVSLEFNRNTIEENARAAREKYLDLKRQYSESQDLIVRLYQQTRQRVALEEAVKEMAARGVK